MLNGNPVFSNEVSMTYLFSAMQARAVEDNVMKNIAPDVKAANVKHNDAENSAMEGIAALKNAKKKNDELK